MKPKTKEITWGSGKGPKSHLHVAQLNGFEARIDLRTWSVWKGETLIRKDVVHDHQVQRYGRRLNRAATLFETVKHIAEANLIKMAGE